MGRPDRVSSRRSSRRRSPRWAAPSGSRSCSCSCAGPATTAELTAALEGRSSGQLFHHLKELLAADVIYQPARGTYAIRDPHVIPILTLLSCALDVCGTTDTEAS